MVNGTCCVLVVTDPTCASTWALQEHSLPQFNNNFANTISVTAPQPCRSSRIPISQMRRMRHKAAKRVNAQGPRLVSGSWHTKVPEPPRACPSRGWGAIRAGGEGPRTEREATSGPQVPQGHGQPQDSQSAPSSLSTHILK